VRPALHATLRSYAEPRLSAAVWGFAGCSRPLRATRVRLDSAGFGIWNVLRAAARDATVEPGVVSPVHAAHPAFSDQGLDGVVPESSPRLQHRGRGYYVAGFQIASPYSGGPLAFFRDAEAHGHFFGGQPLHGACSQAMVGGSEYPLHGAVQLFGPHSSFEIRPQALV